MRSGITTPGWQKYKTFIIFLILISVWSSFFTSLKFFYWGELSDTLKPDLQTISGYLSLGGFFAYLIGGAMSYTFLKKYLLFSISILSLIFVVIGFIFSFNINVFFIIIISFIGFLYGLWSVVKNVIIAIEIKKTGLPDTMVNAFAGIVFVVFVIAGSIIGSLLHEKMGNNGNYVIIGMLALSSILSLFLDYDKITLKSLLQSGFKSYFFDRRHKFINSMKNYIPDIKYITKKYYVVMISSSFLWAISTIVSQSAVEYSEIHFNKLGSEAALVLLFSAVGVIFGNFLSMKMDKARWKYFFIFNLIFSLLIISFPFVAVSFLYVKIFAFVIGIFFGVASNLIDAYFFRKIGDENKKEYGSSTYGLILSAVIFIMMIFSSNINTMFGFDILMYILGSFVFVIGFFNLRKE